MGVCIVDALDVTTREVLCTFTHDTGTRWQFAHLLPVDGGLYVDTYKRMLKLRSAGDRRPAASKTTRAPGRDRQPPDDRRAYVGLEQPNQLSRKMARAGACRQRERATQPQNIASVAGCGAAQLC